MALRGCQWLYEVAHEARGRSRDNKVCINKNDLFNHYPISCTGPAACFVHEGY